MITEQCIHKLRMSKIEFLISIGVCKKRTGLYKSCVQGPVKRTQSQQYYQSIFPGKNGTTVFLLKNSGRNKSRSDQKDQTRERTNTNTNDKNKSSKDKMPGPGYILTKETVGKINKQ